MSSIYSYYVEERKICPICEEEVEKFLPWKDSKANDFVRQFEIIGSDTNNFTCPNCYCHDRERHLFLYLHKLNILNHLSGKKVLWVAPEVNLLKKIFKPEIQFFCGDLHPENYAKYFNPVHKIDLTHLEYENEFFDIVIANHILEHIADYGKALSEIYRVLKKDGIAILQTPFSSILYNNFEDALLDDKEQKIMFFGQDDHVRIFGLRLFDDIEASGFKLQIVNHDDILQDYDPKVYGVNHRESLILARK